MFFRKKQRKKEACEEDKLIFQAINEGDAVRLQKLLKQYPNSLSTRIHVGTWLNLAALRGELECVSVLLKEGMDPNINFSRINNPIALCDAAYEGHIDIVRALIEAGSKLDVEFPESNPLVSAAGRGHTDIVRMLLNAGIDASKSYGKNKKTAVFSALIEGHEDVAHLIAMHIASQDQTEAEKLMNRERLLVANGKPLKRTQIIPPLN